MKKNMLFLIFLGITSYSYGQSKEKLIQEFRNQNNENLVKFEKLLNSDKQKLSQEQKNDLKSRLAGFAGKIPVFLSDDDKPANRSANLTPLQNGTLSGLNGSTITGTGINILVMDGGRVHNTHQEFGGNTNGPLKAVNMEASTVGKSSHTTNVTGIILASGAFSGTINWGNGTSSNISDAQGVIKNASTKNYTYTTTALGTNYEKLAAYGENISNHSYGVNLGWSYRTTPTEGWYWVGNYAMNSQDTYSGSYYTNDENFDKIIYSNPNQIVVKSTGNYFGYGPDGVLPNFKYDSTTGTYIPFEATDILPSPNCSLGYNCIGWGSLAKNVIVVGATYQLTTANNQYTTSSDVVKASFSSAGPRKDGAIKPDITAVGVDIVSPTYSTSAPTANNYYSKGAGTSFAAPIISGIAGALTQVNRTITGDSNFIYKADEMKALLTHTANEAGNPGPDVWYGWGFADATKAAQVIIDKKDNKVIFERNALTSGVNFVKDVVAKSDEPLKVTISWVDPAAVPFTTDNDLQNNHASRLINDLDVRIIDTVTNAVYYPWKLDVNNPMANATTGDNLVDNVEQIIIETPVANRTYTVQVSNKGTLVDDLGNPSTQNYAIITTGINSSYLENSEISKDKLVTIYPTKTKDIITILIPKGGKNIEIFDLTGTSILKTTAKSFQTIDVSNLAKGIYIVNVKTEKGTISNKIIKE